MFKIKYKKVWCFDYVIPLCLWRWCVVEEYQEDLMIGGVIEYVDAERILFKSRNLHKCNSLLEKIK